MTLRRALFRLLLNIAHLDHLSRLPEPSSDDLIAGCVPVATAAAGDSAVGPLASCHFPPRRGLGRRWWALEGASKIPEEGAAT